MITIPKSAHHAGLAFTLVATGMLSLAMTAEATPCDEDGKKVKTKVVKTDGDSPRVRVKVLGDDGKEHEVKAIIELLVDGADGQGEKKIIRLGPGGEWHTGGGGKHVMRWVGKDGKSSGEPMMLFVAPPGGDKQVEDVIRLRRPGPGGGGPMHWVFDGEDGPRGVIIMEMDDAQPGMKELHKRLPAGEWRTAPGGKGNVFFSDDDEKIHVIEMDKKRGQGGHSPHGVFKFRLGDGEDQVFEFKFDENMHEHLGRMKEKLHEHLSQLKKDHEDFDFDFDFDFEFEGLEDVMKGHQGQVHEMLRRHLHEAGGEHGDFDVQVELKDVEDLVRRHMGDAERVIRRQLGDEGAAALKERLHRHLQEAMKRHGDAFEFEFDMGDMHFGHGEHREHGHAEHEEGHGHDDDGAHRELRQRLRQVAPERFRLERRTDREGRGGDVRIERAPRRELAPERRVRVERDRDRARASTDREDLAARAARLERRLEQLERRLEQLIERLERRGR